ncbi:Protein SMG9 [Chelonia mydas]|uniref:Protein SMG9 n=1 Tax=Chelonia mydas TaxID=8469 RepID=M7C7M3_CHEMY|nr:Protein SMG9 [Chelonia mydas]
MKHSIKLVDDQMNWCDSAIEYLLDQTDVLVVGVLGLQGTGKSMLMSLLSANQPEEDQTAGPCFCTAAPQDSWYLLDQTDVLVVGVLGLQGTGKSMLMSLLSANQPEEDQSPSILDHLINNDRKLPPEYNLPHTYVEMQSLQIAAFLFTVCHVVIVVQDWFTDLIFLQNKAQRENFCPRNLKQMHVVIDKIMMHSHLKYKGTLSMLECNIFPGLPYDYLDTEVNLFLLPFADSDADDTFPRAAPGGGPLFSLLPGYKGHPSFQSLVAKLRSQIMSMARPQLSHTILTEKNWFHYAARIWDGVKKSSALSEYSRLLA